MAEDWSFFQDDAGSWRWLHIDVAGKRSVAPEGLESLEAAKEQAKQHGFSGQATAEPDAKAQWYFFRADSGKWHWLKVGSDGKRQIAKEGFATEEVARGAAGEHGFSGEGKVIRQPVSLAKLKTKVSNVPKVSASAPHRDDWHFFEDDQKKWRWLKITTNGKRYVSPVGFPTVKLARANAKNFGYHGIRFNRSGSSEADKSE